MTIQSGVGLKKKEARGAAAKRLLPLNGLRMFAAVGRLLSFTGAAQELRVTASAVSHQIKGLEQYLGVSLLRRSGSRIVLTTEGTAYLRQVSEGLSQLSRATQALKSNRSEPVLRISCPPGLSASWLMRRLRRFTDAHPEIGLALTASQSMIDLDNGEYELGIRYGKPAHQGFRSDLLGSDELFPVCSPKLLKGAHGLRSPSDLRYHALLEGSDDDYYDPANPGWQGWLEGAGVPDVKSAGHFTFSPRFLMQQAVVEGLGVGLSRTLLAADFLQSRQLVCPFGPAMTLASGYYVVCPEAVSERPDIVAFRKWLLSEARASRSRLKIPVRKDV